MSFSGFFITGGTMALVFGLLLLVESQILSPKTTAKGPTQNGCPDIRASPDCG